MKKIFAFVLASLMVLSLVPASAFAAITKCPAVHTPTNCDCTQVGTPVVATCVKPGYTEYVCNDCGEYFVGNLTPKAGHTWESDKENAAKNKIASCIYKTSGEEYVVCKVCKTTDCLEVSWKSEKVHDLVYLSGTGCEKLWGCSICNAKGYKTVVGDEVILDDVPGHYYEFTEILEEPYYANGKGNNGVALFTCVDHIDEATGEVISEGCGATKETVINKPACKHPYEQDEYTVVQPAVAPTCTAAGYPLVVKCPDCAKVFYDHDANPDTDYVEVTDVNADDAINKEDVIINEGGLGHVKTGATCQSTYFCTRCKQTLPGDHSWNVTADSDADGWITTQAATCLTVGYKYRTCTSCPTYEPATINALGHKVKSGSTKYQVFVSATCATPAAHYEYCNRPDAECPLAMTTIVDPVTGDSYEKQFTGKVTTYDIDPDGHLFRENTQTGEITANDIYCQQASYQVVICERGCAEYGSGKFVLTEAKQHKKYVTQTVHNLYESTSTLAAFTTRTFYGCLNEGCEWTTYVDTLDTTIKDTFDSIEAALEYHGLAYRYWTVDEDGEKVAANPAWAPRGLGKNATQEDAKAVFMISGSTGGTCAVERIDTYFCTDCGKYVKVKMGKVPHVDGTEHEGYPATCTTTGLRTTYDCAYCGTNYWYDGDEQKTSSPVINRCASYRLVEYKDCDGVGTKYYECPECKTCYTKRNAATKYVVKGHTFVNLFAGTAATCNTAGTPELRYCSVCKKVEFNTIYLFNGEEVRINHNTSDVLYKKGAIVIPVTKGTAKNSANLGHGFSQNATLNIAKNGTVTIEYNTVTYYSWPSAITVIKTEDTGNGKHRASFLNDGGALASDVVDYADITWGYAIDVDDSFVYSGIDHSKPSFKLNHCLACGQEYINSYVPAVGAHINDAGEVIVVDGCNDDPECASCRTYWQNKAEDEGLEEDYYASKYTFGSHNYVVISDSKNQEPTCSTPGYVAKRCSKCGEYGFGANDNGDIVYVDAAEWHKELLKGTLENYEPEVVGVEADYAHNGSGYLACPVCKVKLQSNENVACPGAGLEIYLSTDAESYIPGSKVYVTVTLDSLMGVEVWGINFPVHYNPEVFKFTGYEFNTADSAFQTFVANEVPGGYRVIPEEELPYGFTETFGPVTDGTFAPSGIISVIANADDEVLIKGEQTLVVLEFAVISAVAAEDVYFEIYEKQLAATATLGKKIKDLDSWFDGSLIGEYCEIVSTSSTPRKYRIDVINGAGKSVPTIHTEEGQTKISKSNEVVIEEFLDIDGKNGVTMADAYELYYLIYNNQYDVKADADFDGYVTAKDLTILYNLITGVTTVESIVIPATSGNELPPEGTIMPR